MNTKILDLDFDFLALDAVPCALVVQVETVDSFDSDEPEVDAVELIDNSK